jgi:peptide deformylase
VYIRKEPDFIHNSYRGMPVTDIEIAHRLELLEPTNPLLNKKSDIISVEELQLPYIQAVIDRMFALAAGKRHNKHDTRQMVGLAAPQLGLHKRIIFIDITADGSNKGQNLYEVINPKITSRSKETVSGREGCWSCGNICGQVERAKKIVLEGINRHGKTVRYELVGFVARIAQHEIDHLDGIRFPDRIPANEPGHLHWVLPEQFQDYRENWMHWKELCPRERWEKMKANLIRT